MTHAADAPRPLLNILLQALPAPRLPVPHVLPAAPSSAAAAAVFEDASAAHVFVGRGAAADGGSADGAAGAVWGEV